MEFFFVFVQNGKISSKKWKKSQSEYEKEKKDNANQEKIGEKNGEDETEKKKKTGWESQEKNILKKKWLP